MVKPKLLDQVRRAIRVRHLSYRTAYSDGFVQLFRKIPSTCSEDNRPPVPRWIVHLIGAKRRWYFVIFQSYLY